MKRYEIISRFIDDLNFELVDAELDLTNDKLIDMFNKMLKELHKVHLTQAISNKIEIYAVSIDEVSVNLDKHKGVPIRLTTDGYFTLYDGELPEHLCQGWFRINAKEHREIVKKFKKIEMELIKKC